MFNATVHLLLTEPVRFVKKLRDLSCEKGKPLKLEVSFAGTPRVNVSWKKDGRLIWASYQYNVITAGTSCILEVLNSDRLEAAGTYACELHNGVGHDRCEAQVSILGKRTNGARFSLHESSTSINVSSSSSCLSIQNVHPLWRRWSRWT